MPFGATFKNDLALLILNATAIANLADNAASAPLTSLYVSLHTADPSAGNQSTSEAAYTSYARVALTRASGAGGWTVSGGVGSNVTAFVFPTGTGGSGTATHFGLGTASSGTGKLLASGALTPNLAMGVGVAPTVAIGGAVLTLT